MFYLTAFSMQTELQKKKDNVTKGNIKRTKKTDFNLLRGITQVLHITVITFLLLRVLEQILSFFISGARQM